MAFMTDTHAATSTADRSRGSFWASFAKSFEIYADRRSRRAQIDRLHGMTDAELAEMGVERERIVQYVYRDLIAM